MNFFPPLFLVFICCGCVQHVGSWFSGHWTFDPALEAQNFMQVSEEVPKLVFIQSSWAPGLGPSDGVPKTRTCSMGVGGGLRAMFCVHRLNEAGIHGRAPSLMGEYPEKEWNPSSASAPSTCSRPSALQLKACSQSFDFGSSFTPTHLQCRGREGSCCPTLCFLSCLSLHPLLSPPASLGAVPSIPWGSLHSSFISHTTLHPSLSVRL